MLVYTSGILHGSNMRPSQEKESNVPFHQRKEPEEGTAIFSRFVIVCIFQVKKSTPSSCEGHSRARVRQSFLREARRSKKSGQGATQTSFVRNSLEEPAAYYSGVELHSPPRFSSTQDNNKQSSISSLLSI